MSVQSYAWITGLMIAILPVTALGLRFVWKPDSWSRQTLVNASMTVYTTTMTLLIAEGIFLFFVALPDSLNFTLSAQKWTALYWNPINSMGYRDIEHSSESLKNQKTLLVLGDSFVAGHGINDCDDRFSNQLNQKLGSSWTVINMGHNGWGPNAEYQALKAFPFRADQIILSYYINDIMEAAARHGYSGPVIRKPTGIVHYFISRSHLLNFLYWRLFRVTQSGWPKDYTQFYQQRFLDPVVWADHVKELKLFVDYCKSKQLPFSVVVFPNLRDVKRTLPITKQVANLFRKWNIPVLDLSPKLANRNPRTLVVNAVDAHPGPALHREVAQLLYEQIVHSP